MKSKIQNIAFIVLAFFTLIACKKKEKEVVNGTSNQPVYLPDKIDGYIWQQRRFDIVNDDLVEWDGYTSLMLFDTLRHKDSVNLLYGIDAGNVTVNNINLKKEKFINSSNAYQYTDTLYSKFNKPCYWSITGNGNFPALSFIDYSSYPSYLGYKSLPDTLLAFASNTVVIDNYYGAEKINVFVHGTNGNIYKTIEPPLKYIVLDDSEMGVLSSGFSDYINIYVTLYKNEFKKVNGKVFQINNELSVSKYYIYLKGL